MFSLILSFLGGAITPIFNWLNARVDATARIHISDNDTLTKIAGSVEGGISASDALNAQTRQKEGAWSPWVVVTIAGFMVPFGWHTTLIVLDSCPWVPTLSDWYLPGIGRHVVGSWGVARLPGLFETTEHAVINSLFVGASALLAGLGLIRAAKK